jgi:hypothetical protein
LVSITEKEMRGLTYGFIGGVFSIGKRRDRVSACVARPRRTAFDVDFCIRGSDFDAQSSMAQVTASSALHRAPRKP